VNKILVFSGDFVDVYEDLSSGGRLATARCVIKIAIKRMRSDEIEEVS